MTKPAPKKKPARKAGKPRVKPEPTPEDLAQELELPAAVEGGYLPINVLLKYQAFVNEYLASGNATEASKKAGFVSSTDAAQKLVGHRLLKHKDVRLMMGEAYQSLMLKHKATPDRIWAELVRIGFCDPALAYNEHGEPLPMGQIPEDTRRAITGYKVVEKTFGEDGSSVEKEMKFAGKEGALDKMIKLHGMFKDTAIMVINTDDFIKSIEAGRERAAQRK